VTGPAAADLQRLKSGSSEAARTLVARHMPLMLKAAERILRSRADAEDAVQEAFISAFRKLDSLDDAASMPAWLHRITVNAAISLYRRKKRENEEPIEDLLPQFDSDGWRNYSTEALSSEADEKLMSDERAAAIRAALARLPDSHRVVLVLRDLEGLSTREAADTLGIQENAVKVRLHRARAALRTLLEPMWTNRGGAPS
jgi:RNA polymerase sigma-70 factor (ECF subfamily)